MMFYNQVSGYKVAEVNEVIYHVYYRSYTIVNFTIYRTQ